MILTFTTMITLWVLTVTLLAVWYGLLFAVGVAFITLAVIIGAVVTLVELMARGLGIFSERKRVGHF